VSLENGAAVALMALMERRLKKDTPPEIVGVAATPGFESAYEAFRAELRKETGRVGVVVHYSAGSVPLKLVAADAYGYHCEQRPEIGEINALIEHCRATRAPLIGSATSVDTLTAIAERLQGANIPFIVRLEGEEARSVHGPRAFIASLRRMGIRAPLALVWPSSGLALDAAAVLGSLICDGIGDLVRVSDDLVSDEVLDFSYNLLQACGSRITKTEFVSCPSCGRTLFDLQTTTERIKSKTGHLKGVKIAIMGCIVNGPGEMADADFGYVGGGPGKINLYVGKTCVEKSIPMDIADERLIDLIKTNGKWTEPPAE